MFFAVLMRAHPHLDLSQSVIDLTKTCISYGRTERGQNLRMKDEACSMFAVGDFSFLKTQPTQFTELYFHRTD